MEIQDSHCCPICLEPIVDEESHVTTSCQHMFHHHCLQQVKPVSHVISCPCCRSTIATTPTEEKDKEVGQEVDFIFGLNTRKTFMSSLFQPSRITLGQVDDYRERQKQEKERKREQRCLHYLQQRAEMEKRQFASMRAANRNLRR